LNIQKKLGLPANPIDILLMVGGRKTKFITTNHGIYKDHIIKVFDEYALSNSDWFDVFNSWQPNNRTYSHTLFSGAVITKNPEMAFEIESFYSAYDKLYIIKELSKKAENSAREAVGVPKIGEGWISETALFKALESEFNNTQVIQHGRPSWLGRQHYDIWFPNWKIAVEYHGKQHFEPVEFFGGQEAFEKTVERDKRKINLSKKHGVKLIVVTEENDHNSVIDKIKTIRSNKKSMIKMA
jgi:hypothetical protein